MDKVDVRLPRPPRTPPANLPKNAEERAISLIGLMGRLTAHLDHETQAARDRASTAEMEALAKAKEPMALVYEEVSRLLRIDRDGFQQLPSTLVDELKAATRALAASAAANVELLRTATRSQSVLVETVVASVNRARTASVPAYGRAGGGAAGGRAPAYAGPRHGPALAVTLNDRF